MSDATCRGDAPGPIAGATPIEDVAGCMYDLEACGELRGELVVVLRRTRRVQLLELCDRAEVQRPGEFLELRRNRLVARSGGSALVENPAGYRHISPEASTRTSTRARSV